MGRGARHEFDPRPAAAVLYRGRAHAGRRCAARQRADPRHARTEKRAQRGRELRPPDARDVRGRLRGAARPADTHQGPDQSLHAWLPSPGPRGGQRAHALHDGQPAWVRAAAAGGRSPGGPADPPGHGPPALAPPFRADGAVGGLDARRVA